MRKLLLQALLLVVIGLAGYAGWWLYDLGKVHGVDELKTLRTTHRTLETLHRKAVNERNTLRDRVAILERSSQVDRQAAQAGCLSYPPVLHQAQCSRQTHRSRDVDRAGPAPALLATACDGRHERNARPDVE